MNALILVTEVFSSNCKMVAVEDSLIMTSDDYLEVVRGCVGPQLKPTFAQAEKALAAYQYKWAAKTACCGLCPKGGGGPVADVVGALLGNLVILRDGPLEHLVAGYIKLYFNSCLTACKYFLICPCTLGRSCTWGYQVLAEKQRAEKVIAALEKNYRPSPTCALLQAGGAPAGSYPAA
jgi:hypothetical protein